MAITLQITWRACRSAMLRRSRGGMSRPPIAAVHTSWCEHDALEHRPHVGLGAHELVHDVPGADGPVEGFVGERGRVLEQARGLPVVVLERIGSERLLDVLRSSRDEMAAKNERLEAARRMRQCVQGGREQQEARRPILALRGSCGVHCHWNGPLTGVGGERLSWSASSSGVERRDDPEGPLGSASRHGVHQRLQVRHQRRVRLHERRPACSRTTNPLRTGRKLRGLLRLLGKVSKARPDARLADPRGLYHRRDTSVAERLGLGRCPQTRHPLVHHVAQSPVLRANPIHLDHAARPTDGAVGLFP